MEIVLWIISGLLAAAFLMTGGMKLMQPKEKLLEKMNVMKDLSATQIKTIGGLEVAGALGLILPWSTGIAEILTPLAALGLVATMVGAALTHLRHNDKNIAPNIVLGLLALFVALSRFGLFA